MSFRRKLLSVVAVPVLGASMLLAPQLAVADTGGSKDIDLKVTIPQADAFEVKDAQFRWGVNVESNAGSFSGDCNFLSAGAAADAGASKVWKQSDGLYKTSDGNTRIEKPNAAGKWADASWANKCLDANGRKVGTLLTETGTGAQVVIDKGIGKVDAAKGTAEISWKGSFSLVFYGGLTYWSLSDPVLKVSGGKGTLTATASGYAADRIDTTKWNKLESKTIVMAQLPKVSLGKNGIVTTPAYKGVEIDGVEPAQSREQSWWGSFPEDWVEYNQSTGQGSYWYSSGGAADVRKVATDVYINYTQENSVIATPIPPKTSTEEESADEESTDGGTGAVTQDPENSGGTNNVTPGAASAGSPVQQLVQQALESVLPASAVLPGVGTTLLEPMALTTSAINWVGKSLIPEVMERVKDYKEPLLWSLAGLLALGSVAWVGFRHGWLVWPFSSKK